MTRPVLRIVYYALLLLEKNTKLLPTDHAEFLSHIWSYVASYRKHMRKDILCFIVLSNKSFYFKLIANYWAWQIFRN